MGRLKRDGNHSPPQNNLIQYSEGNEENGCPVLDSNKTKIGCQGTQRCPQEHLKEKNLASNH
jgi:hypothetical protein